MFNYCVFKSMHGHQNDVPRFLFWLYETQTVFLSPVEREVNNHRLNKWVFQFEQFIAILLCSKMCENRQNFLLLKFLNFVQVFDFQLWKVNSCTFRDWLMMSILVHCQI